MKRSLAALTLILGMATGTIAASAPANAITAHTVTKVTHAVTPRVLELDYPNCPSSTVCIYNLSADNTAGYGCSPHTWPKADLVEPMGYVADNCGVRVWLHQYQNGSGWAICISPYLGDQLGPLAYYPGNLQVTSNTSNC